MLDSKDKLFGATLADLDLAGLNLQKGEYEVKKMIARKNLKRKRKNLSVENSQEELASKIITSSSPTW